MENKKFHCKISPGRSREQTGTIHCLPILPEFTYSIVPTRSLPILILYIPYVKETNRTLKNPETQFPSSSLMFPSSV